MSARPRILIVDDDRGVRETMRVVLGPRYQYAIAENVFDAEKAIERQDFDLVLLDLEMPGGSGDRLLPKLRASDQSPAVIIVTAYGSYQSALRAIQHGVAGYIEKDFAPTELEQLVSKTLAGRVPPAHQVPPDLPVLDGPWPEEQACGHQGSDLNMGFFRALADVLESQDVLTAGHSIRVSRYAVAVARCAGLGDDAVRLVEAAGYLHDIGKIGINKSVLNKTGEFTKLDRVEVEHHPELSAELIQSLGLPQDLIHGVRHHHERLDGSGYPDGLPAARIGWVARIIAVVDSFDAMTWPRIYRREPCSPRAAIEQLRGESPRRYDPTIVDALEDALLLDLIDLSADPIRQRRRAFSDGIIPPPVPIASPVGRRDQPGTRAPTGDSHWGDSTHASFETPHGSEGLSAHMESIMDLAFSTSSKQRHERLRLKPGHEAGSATFSRPSIGLDRLLALPLADFYVSGEDAARMVVRIRRLRGGGATFVDPETAQELPLVFGAKERFLELCATRSLVPLYARLTDDEGCDVSCQQLTDGHDLWIARAVQGDHGGLSHEVVRGRIFQVICAARLQREQIRERSGGAWCDGNKQLLMRIDDWLERNMYVFGSTPQELRTPHHIAGVELHAWTPTLVKDLVEEVPEAGAIRTALLEATDPAGPWAVRVRRETTVRRTRSADTARLWEEAKDLPLDRIGFFTAEMYQDLQTIRRKGETLGQAVFAALFSPDLDLGLPLTRLQTALWSFGEHYQALLLGRALQSLIAQLNVSQFTLSGIHLPDLPLLTPFARRRARLLIEHLLPDATLADLHASCLERNEPERREVVGQLRSLAHICSASHSYYVLLALRYIRESVEGSLCAVRRHETAVAFTEAQQPTL